MRASPRRCQALTLVEMVVAMVVIAIVSTAITALLQGAARSNTAINAMASSQWEVELAIRRMINETRVAAQNTVSVPSGTRYSFTSEPDLNNNSVTYIMTYYQAATSGTDSTLALWEQIDSNPAGANPISNAILIHNLQSFSVAQVISNGQALLNISISAGTSTPTTRTVSIDPRN